MLASTALTAALAGMFVLPGSPAAAHGPGIHGATRTSENLSLRNLMFDIQHGSSDTLLKSPSENLASASSDTWQLGLVPSWDLDLQVNFQYEIFDGADKPTGFWVHANFHRPNIGSNRGECRIVRARSAPDWPAVPDAPYACMWSGYGPRDRNPQPVLDVRAAIEITDPADAGHVLADLCSERTDRIICKLTNATFQSFLGTGVRVGDPYQNLGNSDVVRAKTWRSVTTESSSIPVTAGFEAAFGDFKATVAARHGHTWVPSMEKSGTSDLPVPARSVGWLEYSPALQSITGDWLIHTGWAVWILRDVTFTAPDPHGRGMLTACSADLNDHQVNNTCA